MPSHDLKSMSTDELWNLHQEVTSLLAEKMTAEMAKLEQQLLKLRSGSNPVSLPRQRRPYPKVFPKYQNPKNPAESWSGRGKQPHWVRDQLRNGKKLDRFLIAAAQPQKG
jgi:DNA-binding protein H-NS